MSKFPIVTICGSMKFFDRMLEIACDLTLDGYMVLMLFAVNSDNKTKIMLDEMHKEKIKLSMFVYIVSINGYYGDSVLSEINYALKNNKKIIYTDIPNSNIDITCVGKHINDLHKINIIFEHFCNNNIVIRMFKYFEYFCISIDNIITSQTRDSKLSLKIYKHSINNVENL